MMYHLTRLAYEYSLGFVVTALVICLAAGWLLAMLLRRVARSKSAYRLHWIGATAVVAGLGVWTTHFVAMLGYRPDLMLSFDGMTTLGSAIVAVALVGVPLAFSPLAPSWRSRSALGILAGLGVGGMHYLGMAAVQGCLQNHSLIIVSLSSFIGAACLALACGLPARQASERVVCVLFILAVCGTHFTAIAGTEIQRVGTESILQHENVTLSIFTAIGAAFLFIGAMLAILTLRYFDAQERAHLDDLSTALNNMSNALIYFDEKDRIRLFNRRYLEIFDIELDTDLTGLTADDIIARVGDRKGWAGERRRLARQRLDEWRALERFTEIDYSMDDGRIMEVEIRPVDGGGTVIIFDDVTKDRESQRRITELAFCDPLTKLANRHALNARMERDFNSRQRFSLLMIDLDRFKPVNDTYGHGIGDLILVQVAKRLSSVAGPGNFASRLGGDELAILIYGDLDVAAAVAEKMIDSIRKTFRIGDINIDIGCSIGMCCTDDAHEAGELMQFSDIALYESKRNGRGRASCYVPGMLEAVSERAQLETDMRTAIERGEMHLAYQPVMGLTDGRVIGYEALIRWDHPTLGAIPPMRFIPLAEETGQIVAIGAWVLHEACREATTLPDDAYVAVNVSPVQFRSPLLLSHLTQALSSSGLPAYRLEIELTETAMVEDGAKVAELLAAIRHLGVTVAMDDFGTGYSSLSHLRDFPLDRIKVDRSFVATAETDHHSMAVLEGITHIARRLGISILAEGVETQEQLAMLREIGCDAIQGYLIGRPERMFHHSVPAIALA